jgi:hypothetical protein
MCPTLTRAQKVSFPDAAKAQCHEGNEVGKGDLLLATQVIKMS